jgi:lipoprotein-releasing system ATP-binding protein
MITAQGITKSYGHLQVLKGVDLTVKPAEMLSIMGDSGAGKTTFLQILGTLDEPDAGDILWEGTSLSKRSRKARLQFRNTHLGFVFQFHHLLPEFTAAENVAIPGYIAGLKKAEARERVGELLQFMGLENRRDHKPSQLSGGEQQRVAVARALMNHPRLVLADEPTGNLDSRNAEEMYGLFKQIREEFQTAFVIITHNAEQAAYADRTLHMADGVLLQP